MEDATFIQALREAKNAEDKAALIAEAGLNMLSNEVAHVARQCVLFHWFNQSVVEGLLRSVSQSSENVQDVYEQIASLPFVEQVSWGIAFQDLTRQGLLKHYIQTQPELLKNAANAAITLYTTFTENDSNAIEALFCSIVSGDDLAAQRLDTLLEQAMSRQDWQQMDLLFHLQEEAEQLPIVEPLPRTERYWMLRSIIDRIRGQLDLAINDYDRALTLNPHNALVYLNRSILFMQQQHPELAIADYREAL